MSQALATNDPATTLEQVVINGDLARLSSEQRVSYYRQVCDSLGLNPLTKPFDYITLNGKLTLYARKDATDQLRGIKRVSVTALERDRMEDLYVVTAHATTPDGRQDSSIGAVSLAGLKGEALANAIMKAETKAKRRVTLSICGLGMVDETEVSDVIEYEGRAVNRSTGEVIEGKAPASPSGGSSVRMVTSVDDRLYQRYSQIAEEAQDAGVEWEVIDLPISAADLTRQATELKGRVAAAQQPAAVA